MFSLLAGVANDNDDQRNGVGNVNVVSCVSCAFPSHGSFLSLEVPRIPKSSLPFSA